MSTGRHRDEDVRESGERGIPLREEELQVRKEGRETGAVEIGKEVVSEEKTIDVPVTREEVQVERRPVDRRPSDAAIGEGERIEVPVYEEEVQVEKRPVVYEEVAVGKRQVEETERVSDTVRREVADLDTQGGNVPIQHRGEQGVPHWDEISGSHRQAWEERYRGSGRRWEDTEPGYRYAHDMSHDPRYEGRGWSEVESDLRAGHADWSSRSGYRAADGGDPWERLREDVREAWEDLRGHRHG